LWRKKVWVTPGRLGRIVPSQEEEGRGEQQG
jgi:hypothetical protein